jgi:hypothetical protein
VRSRNLLHGAQQCVRMMQLRYMPPGILPQSIRRVPLARYLRRAPAIFVKVLRASRDIAALSLFRRNPRCVVPFRALRHGAEQETSPPCLPSVKSAMRDRLSRV